MTSHKTTTVPHSRVDGSGRCREWNCKALLVRNRRRLWSELSSFWSGTVVFSVRKRFFVLFVRVCVVARVLRLSCCAFRFCSRWVLHELSVCDAIYLSRTVNIDSLFLPDFVFYFFLCLIFFCFLVFFVFLPTSIPFVCFCLEEKKHNVLLSLAAGFSSAVRICYFFL